MNQARQYSQKPGAIRERTRMTDIETKWRKDRARLLVRVRAGAVPIEDSQENKKIVKIGICASKIMSILVR